MWALEVVWQTAFACSAKKLHAAFVSPATQAWSADCRPSNHFSRGPHQGAQQQRKRRRMGPVIYFLLSWITEDKVNYLLGVPPQLEFFKNILFIGLKKKRNQSTLSPFRIWRISVPFGSSKVSDIFQPETDSWNSWSGKLCLFRWF